MTVARPNGFPTPSNRKSSAMSGPGACKTNLSGNVDSADERDCHPFKTTASSVRLHQSTLEANELGFDCLWPEKSEYKNLSRDCVVDWYVGRLRS